jgi:P pilus assembly chaperone PapD
MIKSNIKFHNYLAQGIAGLALPVAALVSPVVLPQPSHAQTVSVTPMVNTIKLKNGQAKTSIVVTNTSSEPFRARVFLENFKMDETGYVSLPRDAANGAATYVQFSPKELDLAPGVSRTIRVTISLPPSTPDGEYRTALVTEDLKEKKIISPDGNTTVVKLRLASALLLQKGNLSPQLSILSGGWNRERNSPTLAYRNTGSSSTITTIDWSLNQGGQGIKSGRAEAITMLGNSEKSVVIPIGDRRTKQNIPAGSYQLQGRVIYGNSTVPFNIKIDIPTAKN